MARTSPVHYIAPSAISITPNANSSHRDLAVYVARGAKIKVYSPKAGIGYAADNTYQEWTLSGRNRRLSDTTGTVPYTIYARLPYYNPNNAYLVFVPKIPYSGDFADKYPYVTQDGIAFNSANAGNESHNYYYIRLGDVSVAENGQRTVTLDTGILGTQQYNDMWAMNPDLLPLRIELGCTIDDEDAGPTPYVYWGQQLVLTATLTEGWTGTDIQRFHHWEVTRDSGDEDADNAWNHPTGEGSYHSLTDGQITLSHARGYGDDFNGAVSATFTVVAMGRPEEGSESQDLVVLKTAVINIHAETVEKYELAMTANIVGYNPMTQTYDPASIVILIRATDQRGDVFELTKGQFDNAGLAVQYAAVGSVDWHALNFTGASNAVATATLDTATFFAAQQSINVRLMRIVETDDGYTAIELTQQTIAFVRDGEDSKVREWIYRLNSNAGYNSTTGTANGQAVSGQTGGVDNCLLTDDFVPTGWSDDPTGVSQPGDVEWESWRDYDETNHRWGAFHAPVIHNRYAGDGNGISSVTRTYARSTQSTSTNDTTAPTGIDTSVGTNGWAATSPAVTETYPYLWVREVVTYTKSSATTKYYCIGARGDNGVDAKDIEWVYIRTKTNVAPVIADDEDPASSPSIDSNGNTYVDDDYRPFVYVSSGEVEANEMESRPAGVLGDGYGECSDNPHGVDDTWKYEWEAKRTKGAADSNGNRSWNAYSGTMTLHSSQPLSITSANVWYALAQSGTSEPADTAFTLDDFPTTLNSGYYVWQATKVTYSTGSSELTGKICLGPTTDFLSGTEVYAVSTSNTMPPAENTTNWKTSYEKTKGSYLWTATRVQYTNGAYGYLNKKCVGYWGTDGKSITKQSDTLTYAVTAASTDHPAEDSSDWKSTKSAAITAYNTAHSISGSDWQQDTVMWTKTDILWSDNSHTILYSGERNPNDGNPGMSIVIDSQSVTYCRRTAAQGPVSDPSTLRYGSYPSTLTKGDWLYSKTVIVYKTSGGAAAGTTTSYAVSYIGIDGDNGVGISGLTEHYLASDKNYGETGAPTTPSGTNPTDWGTSPMPSNPSWDADHPYLWNYEKIAKVDKDGTTTYERTDASVIAIWTENGKGIDSITNFYKKSSLGTGVGFPAADPDGSGTAHSGGTATGWSAAVQVPDADAPYLWNYERITWIEPDGSNTYTYTDPHVIGHFGKDGENSIRIDLDNEHEDFLYDDAGVRKSGIATSQARLYDGTTAKTTGVTWAVSCFDDDNHWVSQGDTYTDTNAKAKISSSGLLTVEEIYVQSAKVRVRATYNSKYYYAAFTANRTNQDKYELVLSPNSIPCNLSSYDTVTVNISARRLDLQGNQTDIGFGAYTNPSKISTSSSRGYLRLFCAWVTGGTVGTKTSQWNNTFHVSLSDAVDHDGVYFELRKYDSPTASNDSDYKIVDYETVPILIAVNGTSPWVADLDNEMDSVVCDSDGTVSRPQNVSTNVSLCYGSTPKPFSVGVFSDAACTNSYDNGTEDVGVTVSWTSGYNTSNTIQIALAQGDVTISGKMEFYIRLTAQEDNSVQRTLCFTVNGLRPGADGKSPTIYNLLPSTNQISVGRTDSGGYNPSTATLTCGYTSKTGNSSPTVVSEAGNRTGDYGIGGAYNIYFRRHNRGGDWETYYYCYTYTAATYRNYLSGFNVSAYDKVEFVICTDTAYRITTPSNVIDRETVPVVSDGAQGTPGTIYQRMYCSNDNGTWSGSLPADYVEGSNGWHIAPTATTPSARYRWFTERRSDDGGTSWGNGWSTPQIDAYLAENGTSISIKGQATAVIPWGESLPASSTNGNLYLMNNDDADSINQYNNGTWDAVAASIGDGYLVDGHLWMKVRETATASSLRWQDAGQIKGEKGEDGWMIAASPANVILTQKLVTVNTFSAATVSFTAKKGNTPATVASINVHTSSTFNVSQVGVTAVVTAPDKDSNDNYYTEGSFTVDVYVTDPDSGDTVMFTLTVPCYANLLGTWKETVENDTKTEVASQITYGYDNNTGEVGTLQAIGKYIKSSQLYISRIEKTVSGADRNLVVNGAFMSGALNWEEWGTPTTREIYKDTTGRKWMRIVSTTTRYQGYMQRKYSDYGIMVHGGETYTVSLRAKSSSGSATIAVGFHWYRGTEALMSGGSIVQTWKEFTINATEAVYSYTFTVPSDADNFNIMVGDNTTTAQNFFITEIKLELGEIATAWTPNSVDAYSEIRQTADNINLTVNNLSNATQTALNLKADSADLTAMQDGLETAGVHLDGNNSVINLKAGKVNFVDPNGDAYATPKVSIDPTDGTLHAVDGYFSGEVHATSGDFVNVKVSGGMRSPFTYITPNSTFNNDFSDNVAIYSTADNKDENNEAIPTPYNIPWDSSQSGRRIIVANYKWGNGEQIHTGYVKISAPTGKYFFEDGILKPSIYMSREVIELIGYGDSSNFYGWIVLTRTDLGTNNRYGHNMKALAMGVVNVTGSTISGYVNTFDKSEMSLVKDGVGKYTFRFGNTNWFNADDDVFVVVTGCGGTVEGGGPVYANLHSKDKYGFTVWTGDDDTLNDGSFSFIVMNFSDWSSILKDN